MYHLMAVKSWCNRFYASLLPMSKGNEGAVGGWRVGLTCTHITAILGIFTLASITAAADTTTPDSPHEDKPTRQRFRPSSSQPRNQTVTRTLDSKLFIFPRVVLPCWYDGAFPDLAGKFVQGKFGTVLASPCKKGKAVHRPPTGVRPPTPELAPSLLPRQLLRTPRGRGAGLVAASSHLACFHLASLSDCEAPARFQMKSGPGW